MIIGVEVKQFVWNLIDSNSWMIIEGKDGLLIDAIENEDLYRKTEELNSLTIVLTHAHFDHIVGLNRIKEIKPNATVIATKLCSEKLGSMQKNLSSIGDVCIMFNHQMGTVSHKVEPFVCAPADITFDNEYSFMWHGHQVELIAVHGHSVDGLLAVIDDKALFSGDTLLPIPTVTRFPSGNGKRFWVEDVPILQNMKSVEIVYPGHGEPGKLQDMLALNIVS